MQNENKPSSRNLFQRFANKYTFVGLLFVIWIALFDKYSFIDRLQLRSKINQLENEQKYYREKIEEDKRKKEELLGSRDNLEKFAREQYLMKKENEDIFIQKSVLSPFSPSSLVDSRTVPVMINGQ